MQLERAAHLLLEPPQLAAIVPAIGGLQTGVRQLSQTEEDASYGSEDLLLQIRMQTVGPPLRRHHKHVSHFYY